MKVQCVAASALLVVITVTCFFSQQIALSALKAKSTLNQQIQAKTNAKQVRTGAAVALRAERLKQTSAAFRRAVKDLEDRGLRAKYEDGLSVFFTKQQHHARSRAQDFIPREENGDPPPNTEEISYFSFDSPPEKYVGIVYSTLGGVTSTDSVELLITDQITEILSTLVYDDLGNVVGRYYNADYYDLSPWGIYSQPPGYYDLLVSAGKCVSGCGVHTLFQQQPSPSPAPTPGPKKPPAPSPSPTPNPRPMPGPGQILDDPANRARLRCELANCLSIGFGCAWSGPKWPICTAVGCGIVSPIYCHLTQTQ
jgi:hypothetical protein